MFVPVLIIILTYEVSISKISKEKSCEGLRNVGQVILFIPSRYVVICLGTSSSIMATHHVDV